MNGTIIIECGCSVFAAAIVSSLLTPPVIRLAGFVGAIDYPGVRKVHSLPIPRIGGVALLGGCLLTCAILMGIDPAFSAFLRSHWWGTTATMCSLTVLFLVGIRDDQRPLAPGIKCLFQFAAAGICYCGGLRLPLGALLGNLQPAWMGFLDFPLTMLWIVGITNGFNLIDGLDGLAAGVGGIASLTLFVILMLHGDLTHALLALVLAGSLLGFLVHNFNPARIFLGDSGSLFVGLAIAQLTLVCLADAPTVTTASAVALALALPIAEPLLSMGRRLLGSYLPARRRQQTFIERLHETVLPDRNHIHHRLLARGWHQRRAVLVLYLVSCALGGCACTIAITAGAGSPLILAGSVVAMWSGVRALGYEEMAIFRNGLLLSLLEQPLFSRPGFLAFLDCVFSAGALGIVALLAPVGRDGFGTAETVIRHLPPACAVQLLVLHAAGLHRRRLARIGIGELPVVVQAVAMSVAASGVALFALGARVSLQSATLLAADFSILLSLAAGFRIMRDVLEVMREGSTSPTGERYIRGMDRTAALALPAYRPDQASSRLPARAVEFSVSHEAGQFGSQGGSSAFPPQAEVVGRRIEEGFVDSIGVRAGPPVRFMEQESESRLDSNGSLFRSGDVRFRP